MDKEILYFSMYAKKSFNQILNRPKSKLYVGIRKSDFLISDSHGTHRLVGVFYDAYKMNAPQISFICMKSEIVLAKQIAFELGKKIVPDEELSAFLLRNHILGEIVEKSTFRPLAKLYADLEIYKEYDKSFKVSSEIYTDMNTKNVEVYMVKDDGAIEIF